MGIDFNFPPATQFTNFFKPHQYNSPGLNYFINCEQNGCPGCTELIVVKKGFGELHPYNDVDLSKLECPLCNQCINDIESVKTIILYKAKGSIDFKLNKYGAVFQQRNFDLKENDLLLFGDDEMRDTYSSLVVNVTGN